MFGWLSDEYIGEEKFQLHVLETGFQKGFEYFNEFFDTTSLLFDIIPIIGKGPEGTGKVTVMNLVMQSFSTGQELRLEILNCILK